MRKFFDALVRTGGMEETAGVAVPEIPGIAEMPEPSADAVNAVIADVVGEAIPTRRPPAASRTREPQSATAAATAQAPAADALKPVREDVSFREISVRVCKGSPVLPFEGADVVATERYRIIRTNLVKHPKQPRLMCVSSGTMGDGKTINALNIAGALALKQDTRVLLMDCDFRRPALARALGVDGRPGVSDVLAGVYKFNDVVRRITELPNLHFIPAGEATGAPAEQLDSPEWKRLCDRARATFDYVIVDSAPIGMVADYDLIEGVCDGVIVVARENHSNRKRLLDALEIVKSRNKLLGVVINDVHPWFLWEVSDNYSQSYSRPAAPR